MLAIRLQRIGKKNRPHYRVVVSENARDLYGKHLDLLGNYDPIAVPKIINLNADRIKHWISVGAQPSASVHNLLVTHKIIEGKKVQEWKPKKKEKPEGEKAAAPAVAAAESAEAKPEEPASSPDEKPEEPAQAPQETPAS